MLARVDALGVARAPQTQRQAVERCRRQLHLLGPNHRLDNLPDGGPAPVLLRTHTLHARLAVAPFSPTQLGGLVRSGINLGAGRPDVRDPRAE